MRRMLLTAVATAALATPGAAFAHGTGHHRGAAHRHGHRHHVRVLTFRASRAASPGSGTTTSTAPTTSTSSDESAGTIESFSGETLTIKLSDGTLVSGKVTERTEIECATAVASAADFSGGDGGNQSEDSSHDGSSSSGPGDSGQSGDGSGCAGHTSGSDGESGHCTTAALVPGASVKEAELALTGSGAVWEKVEL